MSKCSVSNGQVQRRLMPWCVMLVLAWLVWPCAVMPQPADQPSAMLEVVQGAGLGEEVEVSILWANTDSTFEVGGFDLLIIYDWAALNLWSAETGQLLVDCDWEYFSYRYSSLPPSYGLLRTVALADINDGDNHPTCYANSSGELASLRFLVADNQLYDCQFVPLRFYWTDCGDNVFSSKTGDSLFISRYVYDFDGSQIDSAAEFPTYYGASDACIDSIPPGIAIRMIDFHNGGIDILCSDSIDVRGDVNLNGVPNEVADWVLFTSYFLYGLEVFNVDEELQVQATDINADGVTLTLDDLVYLWRIIIGDALPYPRPSVDTAVFTQVPKTKTVSITYPDSLTAAYLVFRGNIVPISLVGVLDMSYNFDGVYTRVLAFPSAFGHFPPIFSPGPLLTYTGIGVLEQVYTSDYGVDPIPTVIEVLANLEAKTEIEPTPMYAFWAYAIEPIIATAYLGNFAGPGVADINPSTVRINDVIEPISTQILPGRPGFTGEVMEITLSASDLVRGYLPFYDSTNQIYSVTGQFSDQDPFTVFGDVAMIGHVSGDITLDGQVNVADLTYLVEFLFRGGPPPGAVETADLNHNGSVEVSDLTLLVEFLF